MAVSPGGEFVIFTVDKDKMKKDVESKKIKVIKSQIEEIFELDMSKAELDKYVKENMKTLFDSDFVGVIKPIVGIEKKVPVPGDDTSSNARNYKKTQKIAGSLAD